MYKQIKPLQPSGKMAVHIGQDDYLNNSLFGMGLLYPTQKISHLFIDKSKLGKINWDMVNGDVAKIIWGNGKIIHISKFSDTDFDTHKNPLHIFTDYFTTEPLK